MNTVKTLLLSLRSIRIAAFLLLAVVAGSGPLVFAQESVQGAMTLPVAVKFGNNILPPGEYKFFVQLLGTTRSFEDVQLVANPVSVLFIGVSKGTPSVSGMAAATRLDPRGPKALELVSDGDGMVIHSLTLESLGVWIQFAEPGATSAVHAHTPQATPAVASAKGH